MDCKPATSPVDMYVAGVWVFFSIHAATWYETCVHTLSLSEQLQWWKSVRWANGQWSNTITTLPVILSDRDNGYAWLGLVKIMVAYKL